MLGYPSGIVKNDAHSGPGNGSILMDDLRCTGNESSIMDCDYGVWGSHDCNHNEDVGVECVAGKTIRENF